MAVKKKAPAKGDKRKAVPKAGAPSKKTPAMMDTICRGIADGKSARVMCKEVGIDQSTLWDWLNKDEAFSKQYARAREDQADLLADELLEIADDGSRDYAMVDGREVVDHDHIQRAKLRVDTRKWVASKLKPKKYGDKLDLTGDLGVTHKTADDIRGAVNGILARFGVAQVVGTGPDEGARSAGRGRAGSAT